MQKLFRSLIAVGGLAGLVACGDDVTVGGPDFTISGAPVTAVQVGATVQLSANQAASWSSSATSVATVDNTGLVTAVGAGTASITATSTADSDRRASVTITVTAPAVNSVTVSPPNAVMVPGATQGFVANVDADAGVARTVTWSSTNTAVATVTAAGIVTAVAPGATSIVATSTANTAVTGAAAVTVRAPTPATISVQNITITGTPGNTANVNNIFGNIDVNLNVDPGEQVVQRAEVLIDGQVACFQNFSGAQSEDLRVAAAFDEVEQVIVSCQINTALFDALTGATSYKNGARVLTARAILAGGQQVATPSTSLIFNNANTFVANMTLGGTTAQATGGTDGLAYRRGSLTVDVLPVIYVNGLTMAAGSVTFGSAACDVSPTNSARTRTLAASGSGFSATFAQTGTAGTTNVADYEYGAGVCTAPETVVLNATDSNGNSLFVGAGPIAGSAGIRLDNLAPAAPVVSENPNSRAGGWINDAVSFSTVNTGATSNGMIAAAVADAGVNTVTYVARAATTTTVSTAAATADITGPTGLAPSLANAICVVFFAQDALGNRSAAGSGTCDTADADNNTLVGVDRAAPIVAYDASSVANMARINTATIGAEFVLAVTDTGTGGIGVSGAIPSRGTVLRRDAANAAVCQFGTVVSGVCTQAAMATVGVGVYATTVTGVTNSGYFTFDGTGRDAAGNTTVAPATRVIVHDAVLPALSPVSVSLANNFYNGGTGQSFSSFANDDLDAWKVDHEVSYAALIPNIFYGTTVVNAFNATPLLNSNVPVTFTVPFFYRQMQLVTAQGTCAGTPVTISAQTKPDAIVATLFDQANNNPAISPVNTAIPATSVVTGSNTAFPSTMCSWSVASSATTIGDGTATPGTTPRTVTVSATALGPTNSFNPLFSRVDFYYLEAGRLVLIGTATTATTTDPNGGGFRQHVYSISWTPGTAFTSGGTLYAIGSTANGDALSTPASGAITIQP